jgi:hypothetical protein
LWTKITAQYADGRIVRFGESGLQNKKNESADGNGRGEIHEIPGGHLEPIEGIFFLPEVWYHVK